MKRTNIHLTDEQRRWLREHAAETGLLPAAIVRRAIDQFAAAESGDGRAPRALTPERRAVAKRKK